MTTTLPTSMSAGQVRVVDPILSNVALGYKNAQFIGGVVCPAVPVTVSGGQVLRFGKESFQAFGMRRAPGGRMKRIAVGYLGEKYALTQDGLEGKAPFEWLRDAAAVPGIDLGTRAVNTVMRLIFLSLEIEQANLVQNPAIYSAANKVALSGADLWTNDASNPVAVVDAGKEAIREAVGVYPNLLTLGPKVFNTLKSHPRIKDQFKYTSADSVTAEMLARYFDIDKVQVGRAVSADRTGAMTDAWGDTAHLSYSASQPSGQEEPSFAYTYTMEGHPLVEQPYIDKAERSWIYPTVMERAPVITCADAGFLIQTPI